MLGNFTGSRFTFAAVAPAEVPAEQTLIHSLSVPNAALAAGDLVLATPRTTGADGVGQGLTYYGVVIDATHIGIAFVGRGTPTTPNVLTWDVAVIRATGQASN